MPKQAERSRNHLEPGKKRTLDAPGSHGGKVPAASPLTLPPPEVAPLPSGRGRRRFWLIGTVLLALAAGGGLLRWRVASRSIRPVTTQAQADPEEARLQRDVALRPNDGAARRELGSYYENHARAFEAMWEYAEAQRLRPADAALPLRLAAVLEKSQQPGAAIAELVPALQAHPDNLEQRRQLAELYLTVAEPAKARAVMGARRDRVWQDADAVVVLGRTLQATGDSAGAAAAFKRSLALQPQQAEAWYRLGRLSLSLGQSDKARDGLFHALVAGGSHPECAYYTGMTYLQRNRSGDAARAASFFKEAVSARSTYAEANYEYGVALERMGKHPDGLTRYSFAVLTDPNYAEPNLLLARGLTAAGSPRDSHRYLGRYYDLMDRPAEAAREFQAMAAAAPKSASPALLESQVYSRTQQDARAVAVIEAALKRHPDDVQLLERLAALKIQRGDRPYARRLLHHWLALTPKATRPCWLLGRCDYGDLKYAEGVAWEEKALQGQPKNPEYMAFLGGGLLKLGAPGSLDRAAEVLSQAVALAEGNAEFRDLYGQALQRLGRYDEARRQFSRALDIDPLRISCYAPLEQLAWQMNRPAPAAFYPPLIRAMQQRLSEESLLWPRVWQHPADAEAHLKLARFLCRTAELTKARRQLEQALALRPNWPEARQLLAAVQGAQGVL